MVAWQSAAEIARDSGQGIDQSDIRRAHDCVQTYSGIYKIHAHHAWSLCVSDTQSRTTLFVTEAIFSSWEWMSTYPYLAVSSRALIMWL